MVEIPETKSRALRALRELGCKSWKDRRDFLEQHRSEIETDLRELGRQATIEKWRMGEHSFRRLGFTKPRGPRERIKSSEAGKPSETVVSPEQLLDTLPPDTDVGYLIAKGLFDRIGTLEKELADAQQARIDA